MSLEHFFFEYGEETVIKWITTLKIFRLCAIYPYPNDMHPERFIAKISFTNDDHLEKILRKIDWKENQKKPREARFKKYNDNHSAGWVLINNIPCLLDINKILKSIEIEVSGVGDETHKFDNTVFLRAKQLEEYLQSNGFSFIEPPQDDSYCISPKYYPNLWLKE